MSNVKYKKAETFQLLQDHYQWCLKYQRIIRLSFSNNEGKEKTHERIFFFYYYFKPVSQNIMFKLLLIFGSDSLSKISVDAPVTVPHTAE